MKLAMLMAESKTLHYVAILAVAAGGCVVIFNAITNAVSHLVIAVR